MDKRLGAVSYTGLSGYEEMERRPHIRLTVQVSRGDKAALRCLADAEEEAMAVVVRHLIRREALRRGLWPSDEARPCLPIGWDREAAKAPKRKKGKGKQVRKLYTYQVSFVGGSSETVLGNEVDVGSTGVLNVLLWEDEEARYEDSVVLAVSSGQWKFVKRVPEEAEEVEA